MGISIMKRLLLALIAIAFIGANVLPSCDASATMQNTAGMTAPMDSSCSDCGSKAPATDLAKMACGALACAGIVGLPAREAILIPDSGKSVPALSTVDALDGISLAPDPFPPRPTTLA